MIKPHLSEYAARNPNFSAIVEQLSAEEMIVVQKLLSN